MYGITRKTKYYAFHFMYGRCEVNIKSRANLVLRGAK